MKRTTRLLGSVALAASCVTAGSARAALPAADIGDHAIRCGSVTASLSFSPPLTFAGTATHVRIRIKGKLDGCVNITNPRVVIESGTFHGTLAGTTNGCLALTDGMPLAGSLTYRWKAGAETPILQTSSVQVVDSLGGFGFAPAPISPAFAGTAYFGFTLGTGPVTGAFTGGDAGATSSNVAVTSESATVFTARCGAAGIKRLDVGIGTITLQ